MFGKLLKNDLKAQWHSVSTIFLCIFIVAGFAELLVTYSVNDVFGIWKGKELVFVALGGIVVCVAMLFACIVILIAVAMLFSKTMFGRAGYLTLTLPVKTNSLVWSKTISGLVWTYITYMVFFGAFFLWIYQVGQCMGGDLQSMADQIFILLFGTSLKTVFGLATYYLSWIAIAMFLLVQCLYFAITASHVKPLSYASPVFTIVIFFGLFASVLGLSLAVNKFVPFGMLVDNDIITISTNVIKTKQESLPGSYTYVFSGPLFMLATSIGLSFPITALIKHKVNVK